MTKDYFKRLTVIEYTSWDLNCRNVVRHTPTRNKFEKTIKRHARRKDKLFLKKFLTAQSFSDIIKSEIKQGGMKNDKRKRDFKTHGNAQD